MYYLAHLQIAQALQLGLTTSSTTPQAALDELSQRPSSNAAGVNPASGFRLQKDPMMGTTEEGKRAMDYLRRCVATHARVAVYRSLDGRVTFPVGIDHVHEKDIAKPQQLLHAVMHLIHRLDAYCNVTILCVTTDNHPTNVVRLQYHVSGV
jgi:hypothetical protein